MLYKTTVGKSSFIIIVCDYCRFLMFSGVWLIRQLREVHKILIKWKLFSSWICKMRVVTRAEIDFLAFSFSLLQRETPNSLAWLTGGHAREKRLYLAWGLWYQAMPEKTEMLRGNRWREWALKFKICQKTLIKGLRNMELSSFICLGNLWVPAISYKNKCNKYGFTLLKKAWLAILKFMWIF